MDVLGIILVLIWLLVGGINAAQKRRGQASRRPPSPPAPRPRRPSGGRVATPGERAGPKRQSVLDLLREELERLQAEGEAARPRPGPLGRRAAVELPGAEEVEERETLEVEREARSLEAPARAGAPVVVDLDDQAEQVVRHRIEAASARNRAWTLADHRAFDQAIRTEPRGAPATGEVLRRGGSLRDAMVWREILGPPKGLN